MSETKNATKKLNKGYNKLLTDKQKSKYSILPYAFNKAFREFLKFLYNSLPFPVAEPGVPGGNGQKQSVKVGMDWKRELKR